MAEFRTAADQYILPIEVAVKGAVAAGTVITGSNRKSAIMRGDFVVLTPANGTIPAYIAKATEAQVAAKSATHIVALTDETIGGSFVRTDLGNYKASDLVGSTTNATVTAATATKRVGLWPIFDWGDVIPDTDKNDAAANS